MRWGGGETAGAAREKIKRLCEGAREKKEKRKRLKNPFFSWKPPLQTSGFFLTLRTLGIVKIAQKKLP